MAKGLVNIYAGDGKGKSPAALGRALQAAMEGKSVVVLQFLKGNGMKSQDFLRRMEPEIKLFCFEKALLECRGDTDVILTGKKAGEDICALADMVSRIETWKPEANAQI